MIDLHLRDTSENNKHHKKYSKTIQEDKSQKNKVCLEVKYCTRRVNMYIIPVCIWANNLMNVNGNYSTDLVCHEDVCECKYVIIDDLSATVALQQFLISPYIIHFN